MAPKVEVSPVTWRALEAESARTGESLSGVVERLLVAGLGVDSHSVYQVSTSNALVQGVFEGAVTVAKLKERGDLGLGTFEGLDGEMIMIDGSCYRATLDGITNAVDDAVRVPFAVVTRFHADVRRSVTETLSLSDLTARLDRLRPSENLFAAVRVDGRFRHLSLRAACPAAAGEGLVEAVRHQSEYPAEERNGTLVGFWSPIYAGAVNVPGYHFHFISADRNLGGHVLDIETTEVDIGVQVESELHVVMPSTAEFLAADLTGDHEAALHEAENASATKA